MTTAAQAYLRLPADERFETRISAALKRHAEVVARARGKSLSQFVLEVLAERVASEIGATQELALTPKEQGELLRILAAQSTVTPALEQAMAAAEALWGSPLGETRATFATRRRG
jgi:uncharacterized protein (DUF1778 family)